MTIQRVAVIFDNTVRPETTGMYVRRALGALVDVEHLLPSELNDVPVDRFDLFLQIDDGLDYVLPARLRPSAVWVIDTHMDFESALRKAKAVDHVFATQKDGAARLREHGVEAVWLPLACDPEIHHPHDVPSEHDVCFVGNLFPGPRADLLNAIRKRFSNTFVGQRYLHEMAKTYSASKVVFNRSLKNDVNMRVFEALACGSVLITNEIVGNGQDELFTDGAHCVMYRDETDLLRKLDWLRDDDTARNRIAAAGRNEVLARHTYFHRVVRLLRLIERQRAGDRLEPEMMESPLDWTTSTPLPARSVSACLVSWKRPENLRKIVSQLLQEPLIDDIVIWNNDGTKSLSFESDRVTVINSPRNEVTYGRFLAAQHARHDIIYTQDDDCLVDNIPELAESFRLDPSRITHNLKLGHLAASSGDLFGTTRSVAHMALVGWGALFHRDGVACLDRYIQQFGEDELLRRKADRLFSLLWNCRHRSLPAQIRDLPGASGAEALSVRRDHFELTHVAVRRALQLLDESQTQEQTTSPSPQDAAMPMTNSTKDLSYFQHTRPELLERIPNDAQRVLDVGCGTGALGAAVKQRQTVEVWGIERDPDVAKAAEDRLDRVLCGDAEQIADQLENEHFDAIVCGDVLEHLRDPLAFLRSARGWLSDSGVLIASLPNVRHHSVLRSLLDGNWTYEPAGLLDDDHVRFFTRREIEKLFYRAGFDVRSFTVIPGTGYAEWQQQGRPWEVRIGGLTYRARDDRDAEELFAYQYLVEATPQPRQDLGLTSIVMVTYNEVGYTRACLESLRHVTEAPYELIVVDNGSTDGTPDYLDSVPGTTVIYNTENRGFPAAVNQGIAIANGDQILLLNNDVLLTTGWLQRLLMTLTSDATIGLTGPCTNSTAGRQRVDAEYPLEQLDGYAWRHAAYYHGQRLDVEELMGFCLLIRKSVIDEIGLFDERFGLGTYEDVDFCHRARQAGHRTVVTLDAYIHHFGHRSFQASGIDQDALAVESRRKFLSKWSDKTEQPLANDPTTAITSLTSIIILTHNQLALTQDCLKSLHAVTNEPYELIVVDNASTDGTPDYLELVPGITVIRNDENRGFPAAVNQGLDIAKGDQVLLLNNDTVVTTGWLQRMLNVLHSAPDIGLVGPVSNNVSGEQQIAVGYDGMDSLDGFAGTLARQHAGQVSPTDRLIGFCLLIRRDVITKIGGLDERFGIGNYEDDDYCRRAIQAGYRAVIARDAFVHHVGGATFRNSGVNFRKLLRENRRIFEEKWKEVETESGTPKADSSIANPQSSISNQNSSLSTINHKPSTLSLCMIVRDNEATIGPALESIEPFVDEMIVVDTGSTDRTPEICRELGVKVYEFPWCDDFSAARNESLKHATGDWLFWMDSDDTIPEACGRKLRELADGKHESDVLGYVMQVHCPSAGDPHDVTVVDHVKLFRNRPDLRFEHRIHEQILPAIRRAGGDVRFTDIYVVHSGSDQTPDGRVRKLERDYKLLKLDLQERPDHPFVLFNLGMTYADDNRPSLAIQFLQRCLAVSQPTESHVRKAYALLIGSLCQAGRHEEAETVCRNALAITPDDKELLFRQAMLQQHFGRLEQAAVTYRRVLEESADRHFASVDAAIGGYKSRHNLALVYQELGKRAEAIEEWRLVTQVQPDFRPAWRGLSELALETGNDGIVQSLIDQLRAHPTLKAEAEILTARQFEGRNNIAEARNTLEAAIEDGPDDIEPLRELARLVFEHQGPAAAEEILQQLSERDPGDASARHNLGSVYLATDRPEAAADILQQSVDIRPAASATWQLLGHALERCGRQQEAEAAWKQAHDRDAALTVPVAA